MFRKLTFFFWLIPIVAVFYNCSPKINQYENLLDGILAKPEYLVLHRDSVRVNLQGALPVRQLSADTKINFYPEYQYGEGALRLGAFTPFDGTYAVPHSETKVDRSIVFPYLPGMERGELVLKAQIVSKEKSYEVPAKKLAIGLNTAPLLARMGQITPDEPIEEIGKYMGMDFSGIKHMKSGSFWSLFLLVQPVSMPIPYLRGY